MQFVEIANERENKMRAEDQHCASIDQSVANISADILQKYHTQISQDASNM